MNREIKFRAWDGKEILPYLTILDGGQVLLTPSSAEVKLMQYTGLKDKNGKEIYEGDIVTWSDGDYKSECNPRIAIVEFTPELAFYAVNCNDCENGQRYGAKEGYGHKFGFSNFIYTDTENHFDIIGNIYENPKLIK